MEQRLTFITLGVADVGRARTFYERLGWSGESPDGDIVLFQLDGMVLGLWGPTSSPRTARVKDGGGWGGVTLAHNVGSAAEVDAILAEAEAAGASIGRPGAANDWGGYTGLFIDPDGHPWEVAHIPFWKLAEDGSVRLH